ncbi:MAG: riboflavin synthase [Tepidisphaera sp.]|nr:riboflavin synthase [Tepidisphaera sp.]
MPAQGAKRVFTGIIEVQGVVRSVTPTAAGVRLEIHAPNWSYAGSVGDSVACDGCCLTIAAPPRDGVMVFDAIPETLAKTTLAAWKPGRSVHLEHAATASTLLGGHMVQGHIDGVGTVVSNGPTPGGGWELTIEPPVELMPYFAPKGSVAIDGVSLTLAAVTAKTFTIALIPTTLAKTHLSPLKPADTVNLEADVIAKTVVNYVRYFAGLGK